MIERNIVVSVVVVVLVVVVFLDFGCGMLRRGGIITQMCSVSISVLFVFIDKGVMGTGMDESEVGR